MIQVMQENEISIMEIATIDQTSSHRAVLSSQPPSYTFTLDCTPIAIGKSFHEICIVVSDQAVT